MPKDPLEEALNAAQQAISKAMTRSGLQIGVVGLIKYILALKEGQNATDALSRAAIDKELQSNFISMISSYAPELRRITGCMDVVPDQSSAEKE